MTGRMPLRSRALLVAAVALAAGAAATPAHGLDAQEIVRRVETQYRGDTSHGIASMRIVTDAWTRELKMEAWSKGRDRFLVRILEPEKEAGVATLKLGDKIWNYLPRVDRMMRVPSSMMGEGWMGSHFTNDDLVKQDKVDRDYTFDVRYEGPTTAVIHATPKPDAAVVWGELVYTVNHERLTPLHVTYHDEDGALVRTLYFDDEQKIAGRWVPMTMRVEPEETPDEHTRFHYEELEFGVPLDDDRFSLRSLRRR